MSFFHPFTDVRIKDNSTKAVYDLFEGRYNVKNVKHAGNYNRVKCVIWRVKIAILHDLRIV